MKKLVFIASIFLALGVSGCLPQKSEVEEKKSEATVEPQEIASTSEETKDLDNQVMAATQAVGKKEVKRFYPDSDATSESGSDNSSGSTTPTSDADRSFIITPELIAKLHLLDKYDPGVCFGMPGPVPQSAIDSLIGGNKQLAEFLKQRYKLSSDLEIYNKLKQMQNIQLTMTASSKYTFEFMDGQCCTMTFYQGSIEVSGDKASEIVNNKETKTNPC